VKAIVFMGMFYLRKRDSIEPLARTLNQVRLQWSHVT